MKLNHLIIKTYFLGYDVKFHKNNSQKSNLKTLHVTQIYVVYINDIKNLLLKFLYLPNKQCYMIISNVYH